VEEISSLARDTRTRGQHSGEFPETSFCLINLRLRAKAAGNLKMQTDTFKKIPAFSSQWNKKGPASKTQASLIPTKTKCVDTPPGAVRG
jgi:hypothetical protein